jgi:putative redox protein
VAETKENNSDKRGVIVRSLDGFSALATVGGEHQFIIDEPQWLQGTNKGPNPFGLIMSALGR